MVILTYGFVSWFDGARNRASPARLSKVNKDLIQLQKNIINIQFGELLDICSNHYDKKKVACCCVFHLVILYLDSLDVDEPIPGTVPRASVCKSFRLRTVMRKDKKGPGEYGKLGGFCGYQNPKLEFQAFFQVYGQTAPLFSFVQTIFSALLCANGVGAMELGLGGRRNKIGSVAGSVGA